jgi:hypothetical protein
VACVTAAPGLAAAVIAAAPIGIGFSLSTPLLSASLQALTPDDLLSRVMSAYSMAHLGVRPAFALAAGGLATVLDPRLALASFALLAASVAIVVHGRRVADGDG